MSAASTERPSPPKRPWYQANVLTLAALVACCATVLWSAREVWENENTTTRWARVLRSGDARARYEAAQELGNAPAEGRGLAIRALIRGLADADPDVRAASALALGSAVSRTNRLGTVAVDVVPEAPAVRDALLGAARDEAADVRVAASVGLGMVEGPAGGRATGPGAHDPSATVAALAGLLEDREARVRAAAAQALGKMAARLGAAPPGLVRALGDREEGVRMAAARALGEFGASAGPAPPELIAALGDQSHQVQGEAALALGHYRNDPGPALRALFRAYERAEPGDLSCLDAILRIGPPAPGVIPDLIGLLKHPSWEVRGRAAEVLGKAGPAAAEAVPDLVAILGEAPRLRDSAPGALVAAWGAARALGAIAPGTDRAPEALAALRRSLRDGEDPRLSSEAAEALLRFAPRGASAAPFLRDLLATDGLAPAAREIIERAITRLDAARDQDGAVEGQARPR